MPLGPTIAGLTLTAVLLVMAGEAVLAAYNEAQLRRKGAIEAPGDVYPVMRWAYPASFVVMAIDGAIEGPARPEVLAAGLVTLGLAKALKLWAISTLGPRWTFRVLVVPGAPLIAAGPYRFVNHPNYVAVVGELIGVAATLGAFWSGAIVTVMFGLLIRARIRVEDRALGR
jgi:methyltransferase